MLLDFLIYVILIFFIWIVWLSKSKMSPGLFKFSSGRCLLISSKFCRNNYLFDVAFCDPFLICTLTLYLMYLCKYFLPFSRIFLKLFLDWVSFARQIFLIWHSSISLFFCAFANEVNSLKGSQTSEKHVLEGSPYYFPQYILENKIKFEVLFNPRGFNFCRWCQI